MFSSKSELPPITNELLLQRATELSAKIKSGELKCETLIQAYIDRLQAVNPIINAICEENFVDALSEARKIDQLISDYQKSKQLINNTNNNNDENGNNEFNDEFNEKLLSSPLLGIPVTIKESISLKGKRLSCGLLARKNEFANDDAEVVRACRLFGLIPIATSNVPEATLYWADCQNKVYGRTLNPYDTRRITGASSGGEGALIGAGASLLGLGSDIGGSLRLPAHFCGIASFKPSPFLVNGAGNYPPIKPFRLRLFAIGPMARYASDLRPLLKCLLLGQRNEYNEEENKKNDSQQQQKQQLAAGEPLNVDEKRALVIEKLDEKVDLSTLTICYANFAASKLKNSLNIRQDILKAQQQVVERLAADKGCKLKLVDLDEFFVQALEAWQFLLHGIAAPGVRINKDKSLQTTNNNSNNETSKCNNDNDNHNDTNRGDMNDENQLDDLKSLFGVTNIPLELARLVIGNSPHTLESVLTLVVGMVIPSDQKRALKLGKKFEALVEKQRAEFAELLGERGVLILPTMPKVAYKHSHALIRKDDLRFTCLFNSLQVPVAHVSFGLTSEQKPRGLPFGFSCVSRAFNDHLSLTVAETIESLFGGWQQPKSSTN